MKSEEKICRKNWLINLMSFCKFFGLIPYVQCDVYKKLILHKSYAIAVMIFVCVYWIGLMETLINAETNSDKLSLISNWLQMLVNGVNKLQNFYFYFNIS